MEEIHFENPLEETLRRYKSADPCIFVIFGATGDLTARRLVPALYNLAREGQLPPHFVCVGFARKDKTHQQFRQEMFEAVQKHSRSQPIDNSVWNEFTKTLFYHSANFDDESGYDALNKAMKDWDRQFNTKGNRLYYLSTQPSFFPVICENLKKHHLIYDVASSTGPWSQVIIEKPFGHDLQSALALQKDLTQHLDERQIYRIDHWLGKETVQNLLVFRFSNSIFEALWNNKFVDHVQITVGEDLGIGRRGAFFEEAGIMRDIFQNHMMQLLTLVAMEPPGTLTPNAIRDEKVKVLQSIRPLKHETIATDVVRGQYDEGYIDNEKVVGYRQEENVSPTSEIETYFAMKMWIDNWRWMGVPFYMRVGKRLPKKVTEIAIMFKSPPRYLFDPGHEQNALIIRIQPDEGISLKINSKIPGFTTPIHPVMMDFRYNSYYGTSPPEAYERLICDAMSSDTTLFARIDEVIGSWQILSPILDAWKAEKPFFPNYAAGTWGPADADSLIENDGRRWRIL